MAESLSKVITLLNSTPPTNHTIAMTGCWRIVASPESRQPGNYYLRNTDGIIYHNIASE